MADLLPEAVYALALKNLAQNKVTDLRLLSAKKGVEIARGQMYPQITGFAGMGTNYVNIKRPILSAGPNEPTGAVVVVGPTTYDVLAPSYIVVGEKGTSFTSQLNNVTPDCKLKFELKKLLSSSTPVVGFSDRPKR